MPCRRPGTSNGEAPACGSGTREIWHLNSDPSTGREMLGEHYCLVRDVEAGARSWGRNRLLLSRESNSLCCFAGLRPPHRPTNVYWLLHRSSEHATNIASLADGVVGAALGLCWSWLRGGSARK